MDHEIGAFVIMDDRINVLDRFNIIVGRVDKYLQNVRIWAPIQY